MAWYKRNFPDFEILLGQGEEGPRWCKAEAVAHALRRTAAEVLIIADADCYAPRLHEAIEAVLNGTHAWAMPHYTVHRLSEKGTARVLEEGVDPIGLARTKENYDQMPYTGYAGGGITVLGRETYASAPLDPRFVGWGQEDESWATALRALHGTPFRPRTGPLWHLWHPPQKRLSRAVGSTYSRDLRTMYRTAARTGTIAHHLRPAREHAAAALAEGQAVRVPSPE